MTVTVTHAASLPAAPLIVPRPAPVFIRVALLLALQCTFAGLAAAEVWGYVDASGKAHFAPVRVDERYQLFFKGELADSARAAGSGVAATTPSDAGRVADTPAPVPADGRYAALIDEHARRQALDPLLVRAVIAVESGFQPGAVSPKGALGLMQVMPATAARYGVAADASESAARKLLDPATNLHVGTRYLRDLLVRYGDDLSLALAAYNAGELAVERYRHRVPPYPETMAYVQRVQTLLAAWRPPPPAASPVPEIPAAPARLRGLRLVPSTVGSRGAP